MRPRPLRASPAARAGGAVPDKQFLPAVDYPGTGLEYHRSANDSGDFCMRLGYFTMPLHPMERSPTETLQEDREAIILADRLGFHDAFVGEHLTEKTENIVSSMMFLA